MNVTIERIEYGGWPNCCRLSNGVVDLVITTDVGPRVIRFGFVGERNEFVELARDAGQTGGDRMRLYGGHRLWYAPERADRSYGADNFPVQVDILRENSARFTSAIEPNTGLLKTITLTLAPDIAFVQVDHRIARPGSEEPDHCAAWGITALAPGGVGIAPFQRRPTPERSKQATGGLAVWEYTDLRDPRFSFEHGFVRLRQAADAHTAQKIGLTTARWAAYWNAGHLFAKHYSTHIEPEAPSDIDQGSIIELYTDADLLELETLGQPAPLRQGEGPTSTEYWHLFRRGREPVSADELRALPRLWASKDAG
ncbi:MAG: hypothetical protein IT326_06335 [Anaerolineae bacterium]|nr:hypothetical protein [Anaerolineae bacterium]